MKCASFEREVESVLLNVCLRCGRKLMACVLGERAHVRLSAVKYIVLKKVKIPLSPPREVRRALGRASSLPASSFAGSGKLLRIGSVVKRVLYKSNCGWISVAPGEAGEA